jgi:hypothetical protein
VLPGPNDFDYALVKRTWVICELTGRLWVGNIQLSDHWHLHNLGMAETERTLMFEGPSGHPEGCYQAGRERCGIVDTPSRAARTVYVNGSSVAAFFAANALKDVGILKIDAGASLQFSSAGGVSVATLAHD